MNLTKRFATVLGLAVTVVIGSGVPASAGFSDTTAVPTTTYGTATVAAPVQVEAKLYCTTTVDPTTGATTTSATVKIEWWRSTSPGVTGYRIVARPSGGTPYQLAVTGPTDEVNLSASDAFIASNPQFSVTTLTGYGWTATSTTVGLTSCR